MLEIHGKRHERQIIVFVCRFQKSLHDLVCHFFLCCDCHFNLQETCAHTFGEKFASIITGQNFNGLAQGHHFFSTDFGSFLVLLVDDLAIFLQLGKELLVCCFCCFVEEICQSSFSQFLLFGGCLNLGELCRSQILEIHKSFEFLLLRSRKISYHFILHCSQKAYDFATLGIVRLGTCSGTRRLVFTFLFQNCCIPFWQKHLTDKGACCNSRILVFVVGPQHFVERTQHVEQIFLHDTLKIANVFFYDTAHPWFLWLVP